MGKEHTQLMLLMLGAFVAWARSKAADADDVSYVCGMRKHQNS